MAQPPDPPSPEPEPTPWENVPPDAPVAVGPPPHPSAPVPAQGYYGQPSYAYGYDPRDQVHYLPPGTEDPDAPRPSVPGLAITGAVVQIVQSALFLLVGIALAASADDIVDEITRQAAADGELVRDDAGALFVTAGVLLALFAGLVILLAALVLRGGRPALVASIVLQALFGAFWLVVFIAGASNGGGAGSVIPLLVCGAAAAPLVACWSHPYFDRRVPAAY